MKLVKAVIVQSTIDKDLLSLRAEGETRGLRQALKSGGFIEGDRVVIITMKEYKLLLGAQDITKAIDLPKTE